MKWTDETIEPVEWRPRSSTEQLVAELETQPGRWAEVARYPAERIASARSRGSQTVKRHPRLQYAVKPADDGDAVLYFRVPA